MNVFRGIIIAVGCLDCLMSMILSVAHLSSATVTGLLLPAVICLGGLAALAAQSRKYGSDGLRFGTMLMLGMLAVLLSLFATFTVAGLANWLGASESTRRSMTLATMIGWPVLHIAAIVGLVMIGRVSRQERLAAVRKRLGLE